MEKLYAFMLMTGSGLIWFLGGMDNLLKFVIICIVLDFITGLMKAIKQKKLNSKISYIGLLKKMSLILFIGFAHMMDVMLFDMNLRFIAIIAVITHEGLSVLENLSLLGVPVPKKIQDVLEQLNMENIKVKDEKHENNN